MFPREIPYPEALGDGIELQKALGLNSIEEMRRISPKKLIEVAKRLVAGDEQPMKLRFAPVLDNAIIQNQDDTLDKKAKIPLILGSNKDEATFFLAMTPPITTDSYRSFIRRSFGDAASRVIEHFPADSNEKAVKQFIYLQTCNLFTLPAYELAKKLHERGGNVYVYRFNRVSPKNRANGAGASHGEEIPYIFGHAADQGYDETDQQISKAMMKYWVQFSGIGNPNFQGCPEWPQYTSAANNYVEFDDKISVRNYGDDKAFDIFLNLG